MKVLPLVALLALTSIAAAQTAPSKYHSPMGQLAQDRAIASGAKVPSEPHASPSDDTVIPNFTFGDLKAMMAAQAAQLQFSNAQNAAASALKKLQSVQAESKK